jgi:hypothetical protein
VSKLYRYKGKEWDIEALGARTPQLLTTYAYLTEVNNEMDILRKRLTVLRYASDGLQEELQILIDKQQEA